MRIARVGGLHPVPAYMMWAGNCWPWSASVLKIHFIAK